jgi:hypothetical protein
MDISLKKTLFSVLAEKSWQSQFMKMLRFFLIKKRWMVLGYSAKKAVKMDLKPLRRLGEREHSFTAMLLFYGRYFISKDRTDFCS